MAETQANVCGNCVGRSDWDFLKEFYHREEINKQQVHGLQHWVSQLQSALHHAGLAAQKDRIALNKSHEHLQELQLGFNQSENARAKVDNALDEERQEHRMCQESLTHERLRHSDTEKHLECIWNSHKRLGEIMSQFHCTTDKEKLEGCHEYDITELILELEAKTSRINSLDADLGHEKLRAHAQVGDLETRLNNASCQYADEIAAAELKLSELDCQLRREQVRPHAGFDVQEGAQLPGGNRRRRRCRGRGKGGKTNGEDAPVRTAAPCVWGYIREIPAPKQESPDEDIRSILVKAEEV